MSRIFGALAMLAGLALALVFASDNSSQRVTLRLGGITLFGVPLTVVAFGSLLTGMLIMLVAGIRTDLKVRRILRDRLQAEDREERSLFVDRDQQELFGEEKDQS